MTLADAQTKRAARHRAGPRHRADVDHALQIRKLASAVTQPSGHNVRGLAVATVAAVALVGASGGVSQSATADERRTGTAPVEDLEVASASPLNRQTVPPVVVRVLTGDEPSADDATASGNPPGSTGQPASTTRATGALAFSPVNTFPEITADGSAHNGESVTRALNSINLDPRPVVGASVGLPGGLKLAHPVSDFRLTSPFGWRNNPTGPGQHLHIGQDYAVPCGRAVRASEAGTVVQSEWAGHSGYRIRIDHGSGVETAYSHNSVLVAKVGDVVQQGDLIALAGTTGNSTGCHVHFEVYLNGKWTNPAYFVPAVPGQPRPLTPAELIQVSEAKNPTKPSSSATPSPSAKPSQATATPHPSPSATPKPASQPSPSVKPSPTATPSETAKPSETTKPKPSATGKPADASATPAPPSESSATPSPSSSGSPSSQPSSESTQPSASSTPSPSAQPAKSTSPSPSTKPSTSATAEPAETPESEPAASNSAAPATPSSSTSAKPSPASSSASSSAKAASGSEAPAAEPTIAPATTSTPTAEVSHAPAAEPTTSAEATPSTAPSEN